MPFEALAGRFRAGDGALVFVLERRQGVDEEIGRRAGADADDAAGGGVGGHVVGGGLGYGLLEFVLGHGGLPEWSGAHFNLSKKFNFAAAINR